MKEKSKENRETFQLKRCVCMEIICSLGDWYECFEES